jgi:hypothetical protein
MKKNSRIKGSPGNEDSEANYLHGGLIIFRSITSINRSTT